MEKLLSSPDKLQDHFGTMVLTAEELLMLNLINKERIGRGLPTLDLDRRLVLTARAKSRDMVMHNYFGHESLLLGNPYVQMKAAGINDYLVLGGENIAGHVAVETAHQALMSSPGHRANILDYRYTNVGVGIINDGPYGLMITQHFAGCKL